MWRCSWALAFLLTQCAALNAFFGAVAPKSNPKQQLLDLCASSNYCPVPLTVRGTQALVSFAPLAFKLFFAARQNAVDRF